MRNKSFGLGRGLSCAAAVVAAGVVLIGGGAVAGAQTSSGTSASQLKAAQAAVTKAESQLTKLPESTPLKSKPVSGKTYIWINCDVSACSIIGQALQQAVTSVGWKYKELQFQAADPSSLVSALQEALQYKPNYVSFSAIPESLWASVLPAYSAAGVKIIPILDQTTVSGPVIANSGGTIESDAVANNLANYVIAQSKGKAHVLIQRVNDLEALNQIGNVFTADIAKGCGGCQLSSVNVSVAQASAGGVVPAMVSQLKSKPDLNYFVGVQAQYIDGLPAALSTAGINGRVTIAAGSGDTPALTGIKTGTYGAATANPLKYSAWEGVDLALRSSQGMKVPAEGYPIPVRLLDENNKASFQVANSIDTPSNFANLFKKLWHVNS